MHADILLQNRSIPNMTSSPTVTAAERSSDPRQPSRFEKKKNMIFAGMMAQTVSVTLTGPGATPP
jgi:hypothetical protein